MKELTEKQRMALREHPFPAGRSGNPGGRPRRKPITELFEEELEAPCSLKDHQGQTWRQAIAVNFLGRACKGAPAILSELMERVEGKVSQEISIAQAPALALWERFERERRRVDSLSDAQIVDETYDEINQAREWLLIFAGRGSWREKHRRALRRDSRSGGSTDLSPNCFTCPPHIMSSGPPSPVAWPQSRSHWKPSSGGWRLTPGSFGRRGRNEYRSARTGGRSPSRFPCGDAIADKTDPAQQLLAELVALARLNRDAKAADELEWKVLELRTLV